MARSYFPSVDEERLRVFGLISANHNFSDYINEIVEIIHFDLFNRETLEDILGRYNVDKELIKEELIEMLLIYINYILIDKTVTEDEACNVRILKRVFKIAEGDFYEYRYTQITKVLRSQFSTRYSDSQIIEDEGMLKVRLQELFDLGYDQFLEILETETEGFAQRQ